jgi:hypothetical protein
MAKNNHHQIIAIDSSVTIEAAEGDAPKGPRSFTSTFYTGGPLTVGGWDMPVVVDLAGLKNGKVLVANLDHDASKRVGNFQVSNDGRQLVANGRATAATAARDEVVNSAADGYQWQASLEVQPHKVEELAKGKTVEVNGQQITGPAYITREGTLKGFAFVSHGADDNTSATIAASSAPPNRKERKMEPNFKKWVEAMGFDADSLTDENVAGLKANYEGQNATRKKAATSENPFEARKIEAKRINEMREIADRMIEARNSTVEEILEIEKMYDHAVSAKMEARDFKLELMEATLPKASVPRFQSRVAPKMNNRVVEAAICQAGRMDGHEKHFDDQTLQAAHDQFKGRIGLKQLLLLAAQDRGYQANYATEVNIEVQRAAFGMQGGRQIHATGFSTIDISTILSNVANKFLREGWNAVDMTPMRIAAIRPVNDFKTVTTVSLTGDLQYDLVGAGGEIKHGTLGQETYSNKADTYARMLAITRNDIINDDLGALTAVPRRLGRGAGLKLNDIFWTRFLDNSAFFTSGRNNVNEGVADMTVGGLTATETIFMNQVDPNGKPLGLMPALLLVPTALKVPANSLMRSERLITGGTGTLGEANPYAGRFRVESSPYMSNSSYTGFSAAAWYMLADPAEMPVIEIAALYGRVEPVVETADADFNVLGVQMRGYSDIGVALQEYRGGVRADGGSS